VCSSDLALAFTGKAVCELKATVTISPGVSQTPHVDTFSATGKLTCGSASGTMAGPVTLTGGSSGPETCTSGAGSGSFTADLSGSAGTVTATGSFTYARTAALLTGKITLTGDDSGSGSFDAAFVPSSGTCQTTPVTKATVLAVVQFKGTVN